jgi:hypothetical protein
LQCEELHKRLNCKSMEIKRYIYMKRCGNKGVIDRVGERVGERVKVVQGNMQGDMQCTGSRLQGV